MKTSIDREALRIWQKAARQRGFRTVETPESLMKALIEALERAGAEVERRRETDPEYAKLDELLDERERI